MPICGVSYRVSLVDVSATTYETRTHSVVFVYCSVIDGKQKALKKSVKIIWLPNHAVM